MHLSRLTPYLLCMQVAVSHEVQQEPLALSAAFVTLVHHFCEILIPDTDAFRIYISNINRTASMRLVCRCSLDATLLD